MTDANQLIKRHESLKAERRNWDTLWEDTALYVMPNRADFVTQRTKGDRSRTEKLYDSTAIHSNQILAASLHVSLTSPSAPWFSIRFRDDELNEDDEAKSWLEHCADSMFNALSESNFSPEMSELYLDLGAFGTGALLLEEGTGGEWGGFRFEAIHLSNVCIAENAQGKVDTVYRQFKLSARAAAQRWAAADMPKVRAALERDPDQRFTFVHCVHPAADSTYTPGTSRVAADRPFVEYYVCVEDLMIVGEGGYYELPYFIPRWQKLSGDPWGFGPGLVARADITTLNEAKRLELTGWEKSIDPPFKAGRNAIIGDLHLEPGGLTIMREMRDLQILEQGTRWDVSQIKSEELRQSIRNMFFADQLQLPERPNATATEVTLRYEMMQRLLGPTLGRLQSELLTPMVERMFYMMFRAGQFDEMPESAMQSAGSELDIEYVSPLARAQKMGDVQAIERWIGALGGMAQMNPEILDVIDFDAVALKLADRQGVPADVRKGKQEIEQSRTQRQEQMKQQMEMQQQMAGQQAG
jgi:hypothetical protein